MEERCKGIWENFKGIIVTLCFGSDVWKNLWENETRKTFAREGGR